MCLNNAALDFEVYKGEEYLARVKQSKELGIGLNDKTLAYLTDEEYSQVVNLAQKSNGSNNAGNAGNNDIAPPMDIETAQKRFDQLDKIKLITSIIFINNYLYLFD
jgi:hypothetical protein